MSNAHLTPTQITRFVKNQLATPEVKVVEAHLRRCRACQDLVNSQARIGQRLASDLKTALGQPEPPTRLRHQVYQRLATEQATEARAKHIWPQLRRWLNSGLAIAIILIIGFAAWQLVLLQMPPQAADSAISMASVTATPTQTRAKVKASPTPVGETPTPLNTATSESSAIAEIMTVRGPVTETRPPTSTPAATATSTPIPPNTATPTATSTPNASLLAIKEPEPPGGLIAFSFYNAAGHRQLYEIHLIDPTGQAHQHFALDGVSEPSLGTTEQGLRLAFRAWPGPTEPRALSQSKLDGTDMRLIGRFWEDAQPDWSPDGNWIIYASQREQDRRWRLYVNQNDGRRERNLGLPGKRPSFAPDSTRFVYEGCDLSGNRCGLWQANIDDPGSSASPILADATAVGPDWSPVDDKIVYMMKVADNWDLYLVSADGQSSQRLTTNPAIDGLPAWSPDGQWLAFLSNRSGKWGIWRLHLETGQLAQVYAFDGGIFTPPHGEPYGQRDWWDEQLSWSR